VQLDYNKLVCSLCSFNLSSCRSNWGATTTNRDSIEHTTNILTILRRYWCILSTR
jgi:hypothetical protein